MLLQNGFREMYDVLDDVPYRHWHRRQNEQAAYEDKLIVALETVLHRVNNEQWHHYYCEDGVCDDQ